MVFIICHSILHMKEESVAKFVLDHLVKGKISIQNYYNVFLYNLHITVPSRGMWEMFHHSLQLKITPKGPLQDRYSHVLI